MKRKSNGFTLIEMIIVLAITGIIFGIGVSMFMTGNKVFSNSDVKTTLQMDAKDIQEKISNICMQANSIKYVSGNKQTGEITKLILNLDAPNESSDQAEIKLNNGELNINGFKVPSKVSSMKINKKIVDEAYEEKSNLSQFNSINFYIELEGKKKFDSTIYPVKFTVTFRNRK